MAYHSHTLNDFIRLIPQMEARWGGNVPVAEALG